MIGYVAIGGAVLLFLAAVWHRLRQPLLPESLFRVTVSDERISCRYPDGNQSSIALVDVASIRIRTNDSGPWDIDVLWGFHAASGDAVVVVPNGATGEKEMMAAIAVLPGFRDDVVIEAMGSTANREFVCWERTDDAPRS